MGSIDDPKYTRHGDSLPAGQMHRDSVVAAYTRFEERYLTPHAFWPDPRLPFLAIQPSVEDSRRRRVKYPRENQGSFVIVGSCHFFDLGAFFKCEARRSKLPFQKRRLKSNHS
jgi:hypothetical protein